MLERLISSAFTYNNVQLMEAGVDSLFIKSEKNLRRGSKAKIEFFHFSHVIFFDLRSATLHLPCQEKVASNLT